MKVLIDCPTPFALAHGGAQIQIEQTLSALKTAGLEAEPLRWWDGSQPADIIHYFGRMPAEHIRLAHQKNIKVVMSEMFTAQGSRSRGQLALQKLATNLFRTILPSTFTARLAWDAYRLADAWSPTPPGRRI